jgi:aminodeoxyfutalosine deaminase
MPGARRFPSARRMSAADPVALIAQLPKVELHVHLEGSMRQATVVELAARHGVRLTEQEVAARYQYADFHGFLEAYKWVTSFLRTSADYALITERLADELIPQNVVYAEVTISAGVMLWRKQDAAANLLAIHEAGMAARKRGLRMQWIPDATRQFGAAAAMEVAKLAAEAQDIGSVAFGMGGDEQSRPAEEFREAFEFAASRGLHRVSHAGEIGGPAEVQLAIEALGAERIGHGIAVMHDVFLRETMHMHGVVLEICPTSNLRTGALAKQLRRASVALEDHPVTGFLRQGVPLTISTDDPAMFETTLNDEYALLLRLGVAPTQLAELAAAAAGYSFLPEPDKTELYERIQAAANSCGLL